MRRKAYIALACISAAGALSAAVFGAIPEYGRHGSRAAPSCPGGCQVLGRVTAIQVRQGRDRGAYRYPFRIHHAGRLVGFSIHLSKPSRDQQAFFDDAFGGPPRARISVLRPRRSGNRESTTIYRLVKHSGVVELRRYLGSKPRFALVQPLRVGVGDVAALTVPTWAPALAIGLTGKDAWRAPRNRERCDNVEQNGTHQRRNSVRTYACFYTTARILYNVDVIPDPRRTN